MGHPQWALRGGVDYDYYCDIPLNRPIDDTLARRLIHGYYATVSFMDAQVGRMLAELDRLGLTRNTIVVLWGDHGFHLGENSRWGKQTCYEMANRQPLIVCAPAKKGNGRRSPALVETVDIYPTLCELAGLPLPAGLEGRAWRRCWMSRTAPGRRRCSASTPGRCGAARRAASRAGRQDGLLDAHRPLPLRGVALRCSARSDRGARIVRPPGGPRGKREPCR